MAPAPARPAKPKANNSEGGKNAEDKWYDFDVFLNDKTQAANKLLNDKIAVFEVEREKVRGTLASMTSGNVASHTFFKAEITLAKNVLACADALLCEQGEAKLAALQHQYSVDGEVQDKSSHAGGSGEKAHTLYSSPPTATLSGWNTSRS